MATYRQVSAGGAVSDAVVEAVASTYESDIVLARQIALAPPPAPAALPPDVTAAAAPTTVAGVAMILNAITNLSQTLDNKLDAVKQDIRDMQRDIAINGNITKGTGLTLPYAEVLFLDGTRPTVAVAAVPAQDGQPAQPGRPALPLIDNITALRNLQGPDTRQYLVGYGIAAIPHPVGQRRQLIARCIGCVVDV